MLGAAFSRGSVNKGPLSFTRTRGSRAECHREGTPPAVSREHLEIPFCAVLVSFSFFSGHGQEVNRTPTSSGARVFKETGHSLHGVIYPG